MKIITTAIESAKSYPAYVAAKAKLAELHLQRSQADRELTAAQAGTNDKKTAASAYSRMVADAIAGKPIDLSADSRRDETLQQAYLKVKVMKAAVSHQERDVRLAHHNVVQELGPLLKPQHAKLVKEVAKALRALSDAMKAEEEYRFAPELRDFDAPGIYQAEFRGDPRLFVTHSDGINWLADLKGAGYDV